VSALSYQEINFCLRCGAKLTQEERFGRVRPACSICDWVYFPDPKVAVAALIEEEGQILLVRRANDPQRGLWTLPAGFVDAGEDPALAITRECLEETGLKVRVTTLLDVLAGQEHPRGAHILIVYCAEVVSGQLKPGDDVDGAAYYALDALPPLAFSSTQEILARRCLNPAGSDKKDSLN
jgi:ADP-ribose pyrophosphatase YjhB (NUDIX family)